MNKNKKTNVRYLTITAMLSAVASALMFLDFPLPIFPSFLKLDFSDLPALLASFMLGPISGVFVELIKNLIHLLRTSTGGIGELANFLVGAAFVIPSGIVYRRNKTRKSAIIGMLLGILLMAVVAGFANYYLLIPFFTRFMPLEAIIKMCGALLPFIDSLPKVILFSIVPFNILKGIIVACISLPLYKRLSVIIKKAMYI